MFKNISVWCIILGIVILMIVHHILSDKPLIEGIGVGQISSIEIECEDALNCPILGTGIDKSDNKQDTPNVDATVDETGGAGGEGGEGAAASGEGAAAGGEGAGEITPPNQHINNGGSTVTDAPETPETPSEEPETPPEEPETPETPAAVEEQTESAPSCVGGIISTCNVDFQYIGEDDCPNRYVADTVNSTSGYLQCKLNNDRSACNKWNNSNKSDKIECEPTRDANNKLFCSSDTSWRTGPPEQDCKCPTGTELRTHPSNGKWRCLP